MFGEAPAHSFSGLLINMDHCGWFCAFLQVWGSGRHVDDEPAQLSATFTWELHPSLRIKWGIILEIVWHVFPCSPGKIAREGSWMKESKKAMGRRQTHYVFDGGNAGPPPPMPSCLSCMGRPWKPGCENWKPGTKMAAFWGPNSCWTHDTILGNWACTSIYIQSKWFVILNISYILYFHPSRLMIPVDIFQSLSETCSVGLCPTFPSRSWLGSRHHQTELVDNKQFVTSRHY